MRYDNYVRISFVNLLVFPFDVFWGHVLRELLQRLFTTLHGTLGSYLRDALYEGGAEVLASYLPFSRALSCLPLP
jgi:hypothetical protein